MKDPQKSMPLEDEVLLRMLKTPPQPKTTKPAPAKKTARNVGGKK